MSRKRLVEQDFFSERKSEIHIQDSNIPGNSIIQTKKFEHGYKQHCETYLMCYTVNHPKD